MSKLTQSKHVHGGAQAINDVAAIISTSGSLVSKAMANNVIGVEGVDDSTYLEVQDGFTQTVSQLRDSALGSVLLSSVPEHQVELALESAAFTLMAAGDLEAMYTSANNKLPAGGTVINPAQGNEDYTNLAGLESFDAASSGEYLAQSVIANAMSVVQGNFADVWFPTQIVAPGVTGVNVAVSIPKIYPTVVRNADGVPVAFDQKSIIDALIDSSILDIEATAVVPYAADATNPAALVPAADVPTTVRNIDGLDIDTRPILFGTRVDLIGLSAAPGLLSSGTFDETDSLDTVINIGKVYNKITVTDGVATETVVIATDVSNQLGSLLTKTAEGTEHEYQANMGALIGITQDTPVVLGDAAAFKTIIETLLSILPGEAFNVSAKLTLAATADTERGEMEVFANRLEIVSATLADGTATPVSAFSASTLVSLGYTPDARRTNTNMRTRGTIIDTNNSVSFTYPVPLGSPLISQNPIGGRQNTTLEGLIKAQRVRTNGNAVKALMNMEATLRANNGTPVNSPAIGALMITPKLIEDTLDISTLITSLGSKDAMENVRGHLVAACTNAANALVLNTGYLAALEFLTGSTSGFEFILVTDSHIKSHLMSSGDARTLGTNNDFIITESVNKNIKGKIYISMRLKERSGISPLSFGAHLHTPSITQSVQVTRNGSATIKELHTIPREATYAVLPALVVITVNNLESLFVD